VCKRFYRPVNRLSRALQALLNLRHISRDLHTDLVDFLIRDYRAADFNRLWAIDQRCFPLGISYTR
jgi:hypothetical protein